MAVASLAMLGLDIGAAGAAPARGPAGAPGNNGTVKIHEKAGEPAPETRNEPHVCTFHLHAMFFDASQELSFRITSWPPTGDRSVVLSGTITADGTGEGRTPGEYGLADGHYRLTVDTGNGKPTQDKHKMFWVQCAAPTTPPSPPGGGGGGGGGGGRGGGGGGGDLYSAPATTVSPTTPPAALGEQPVPPANLAETGSSALLPIAGLGLALLLAGLALVLSPATRARPQR